MSFLRGIIDDLAKTQDRESAAHLCRSFLQGAELAFRASCELSDRVSASLWCQVVSLSDIAIRRRRKYLLAIQRHGRR